MWKTKLEINVNHCHKNNFIRHIYKSLWPYIGCNMISFCFFCPSNLELLVCFIYKNVVSRKFKKTSFQKFYKIILLNLITMVPTEWISQNGLFWMVSWHENVMFETVNVWFNSVQSFSCVWLFVTPWTTARQASLSITNSWSLLKLMSIESMMPPNYLTLCHHLLFLSSFLPHINVFSKKSVLRIRRLKYWSFSFSISPSNEYSGLISFRMNWLDCLAIQGTLKSLLQHHSSKASVLWCSAFFTVPFSHSYMTTGKKHSLD